MSYKHGLITSVLKILILSVVVFFVLYFLFPGASLQLFGTSVKDRHINKASESVMEILAESDLSEEELARIEVALEEPRVKQALMGVKDTTATSLSAITSYIEENYL